MTASAGQFLEFLASQEDVPYLWGGRADRMTPVDAQGLLQPSPYQGFDCWGLVAVALQAAGGPDWRGWWTDLAWAELPAIATPRPGDLVFWAPKSPRNDQDVEHVEVVVGPGEALTTQDGGRLSGYRTIGASGGTSLTTTLAMAQSQRAAVRYRPNHLQRPRVAGFRRLPLTHAA